MRLCTKCKVSKPLTEFFAGAGYKDGFRRQCKACCSQANNARGKANRRRKCGKCRKVKDASEFARSKNNACWCKDCCAESARKWRAGNPELVAAQNRRWQEDAGYKARMQEYGRRHRLFRRYGVTVKAYDDLFNRQGGLCAICREPPSTENSRWGLLQVDHCHVTGAVRGLLCGPCNMGLGNFKDDLSRLESARSYLNSSSAEPRSRVGAPDGRPGSGTTSRAP